MLVSTQQRSQFHIALIGFLARRWANTAMAAPSREGLGARTGRQSYVVPSGLDVVVADEGEQDMGGYGGSLEDLGQKIYLGRDMISSQQGAIGR
jgi:hypothetical protein